MRIPKNFKLGAITWKVEETPHLDIMGKCDMEKCRISLQSNLAKDVKEQVFCHELMHSLLFATGRMEHDETLVDSVAVFLHQYLTQNGK